ncbi:MAG TPA: hypothetical protein VFX28_02555, partial [Methylomirabilota bacterium]|nr:hypothetical protein [Methylomirabilota bacterium]
PGPACEWCRIPAMRAAAALLLAAGLVLAAAPAGAAGARRADVEELLSALQLVPLDGQLPAPFTLAALDGRKVALAETRGRLVLVYFWATW